jgi:DMSO/TMAO reductase YedYZ molybdopterin-dependent catalytic subunit
VSAGTFGAPLTRWEAERALLALRLGGEPLAVEHGAPVRLILPDADCYTSIKWLDHIEACAEAGPNTARRTALKRIGADPDTTRATRPPARRSPAADAVGERPTPEADAVCPAPSSARPSARNRAWILQRMGSAGCAMR